MIETARRAIGPEVVNAMQATLGVTMTSAGAANLVGWIDIVSSFSGLLIAVIGLVLTFFTTLNAHGKFKQTQIKTKMDLLEYYRAKSEYERDMQAGLVDDS